MLTRLMVRKDSLNGCRTTELGGILFHHVHHDVHFNRLLLPTKEIRIHG